MKTRVKILSLIAAVTGCLTAHAQLATINVDLPPAPDSIIQITAEAQGLQLTPRDAIPRGSTFWLFLPNGAHVPLPCPMILSNYPIYAITGNQYIMDGTGGQVAVNTRRLRMQMQLQPTTSEFNAALESLALSVVNLITEVRNPPASLAASTMN